MDVIVTGHDRYMIFPGVALFLALLLGTWNSSAQIRDTVWVGYDHGKADSLITYDGQYIGTAYAHQVAGWQYALKMDLLLFGTDVQGNDFWPIEMSFDLLASADPAGPRSRAMTALVWEDSSGLPGPVLAAIPFTMEHRREIAETLVVIDLRPFTPLLLKKNPLWVGFEEGNGTGSELFSWMRSSYVPGRATFSYDRPKDGRWLPITQPVYWAPELRPGYNLLFQVRYVGDDPIDVEGEPSAAPYELELDQNYPNPAATFTTIRFRAARHDARLHLIVYDALGRKVAPGYEGAPHPGWNAIRLPVAGLSPGLYRYLLTDGRRARSRSMVILR